MKISEENKIKLFAVKSMVRMYARTDEDFGRYCRGFYQGMITVMGSLGVKARDILPAVPPDELHITYASFCATYGAFLADERKPRMAKDSEDHAFLYGHDAQEMMVEAERHLSEIKKRKKGEDH